jgi:hypothetical protein
VLEPGCTSLIDSKVDVAKLEASAVRAAMQRGCTHAMMERDCALQGQLTMLGCCKLLSGSFMASSMRHLKG